MNRRTLFQALIGSAAASTVAAKPIVAEIGFDTQAYLEAVNQIPLGPFISLNGQRQTNAMSRPFGHGLDPAETFVVIRPIR